MRLQENFPSDSLVPIPAPDAVKELSEFPVPENAVSVGLAELDLCDDSTNWQIRERTAELAKVTAAEHGAEVDLGDIKETTAELAANATRSGRHLRDVMLEWHDKPEELPLKIAEAEIPSAIGYVVIRVVDDQPGWFEETRPDHDFDEAEAQESALVPVDRPQTDISEDPFSEHISLEDFPELKGMPSGQSGRGLHLVGNLALAAGYYVTNDSKAVVTVFAAHRSENKVRAA